jgi:glycosyltransferase involved in cell wall biosynthesis
VLTLPGRLSRLKGHEDFIELIARLRARGLSVRGLIVGGPEPRRQRYADGLARDRSVARLGRCVLFAGHRGDMREIYAVSTLVLSLSAKPESFGRTVLEALSLGVPVIGYDHGGVGEILVGSIPPVGAAGRSGYADRAGGRVLERRPTRAAESGISFAADVGRDTGAIQALCHAPRAPA